VEAKTVLVVEDHAETRDLITYNLESAGYTVRAVENGTRALELALRIRPALVLLDVMLPGGMDGLEICRRLKAEPRLKTVPVIMLTARGDEVDRIVGLELGAEDYVVKPFSPRELVQAKGRVLSRDRLLDTVWETDFDGTSRTIDTHVRRLRGKLGRYADWVETVRGVGYRFNAGAAGEASSDE